MPTYLLKTEPTDYAYDDLVRDQQTTWEGVKNNAALIHLRAMQKGDEALIYHTGNEKRIAGLAVVTKSAYEDPKNPGANQDGAPKFAVIDLKPKKAATKQATLADIKADPRFEGFDLVRQGRLSAMPVPAKLDKALRAMAGL